MTPPTRPVVGTAIALLLALGLAACSGSGTDRSTAVPDLPSAADAAAAETDAVDSSVAPGVSGDTDGVVDREVVVTGSVELVADDPAETVDRIVRMVEQADGRIENLTESPGVDGEPGHAALTLRVPVALTTGTVDALADLAEVRHVELARDDVTRQGQDLDARVSALTTSTARLTELLGSAATTADLLDVERELATRQAELDSLVAQREALSDQVAMSTVHVVVTASTAAVTAPRGGFLGGLGTGWDALVATARTAVLVLGVLLPWLAAAGVGWVAYRLVRRRTRRSAGPAHGDGPTRDGNHDGDDDGPAPGTPVEDPERRPALTR